MRWKKLWDEWGLSLSASRRVRTQSWASLKPRPLGAMTPWLPYLQPWARHFARTFMDTGRGLEDVTWWSGIQETAVTPSQCVFWGTTAWCFIEPCRIGEILLVMTHPTTHVTKRGGSPCPSSSWNLVSRQRLSNEKSCPAPHSHWRATDTVANRQSTFVRPSANVRFFFGRYWKLTFWWFEVRGARVGRPHLHHNPLQGGGTRGINSPQIII